MDRDEQLEAWVQLYVRRLVGIAYSYVHDVGTAEDRVQDALIKAYHSAHQLQNSENPYPWLVQIVINECRNVQRRKYREIAMPTLPEQHSRSTEDAYLHNVQIQTMYRNILRLPEKYRVPIILRYFEEQSTEIIATILDTNARTVRTRLARGRKRLQRMLKEDEENERERSNIQSKIYARTHQESSRY